MQELLDRIKERNFGKTIELREYSGKDPVDYKLLHAGIGVGSIFVNGQDLGVTLYGFNEGRYPERDEDGELDDTLEIDNIITKMIRLKFN